MSPDSHNSARQEGTMERKKPVRKPISRAQRQRFVAWGRAGRKAQLAAMTPEQRYASVERLWIARRRNAAERRAAKAVKPLIVKSVASEVVETAGGVA